MWLFAIIAGLEFSMGHSYLCLAEAGGRNGAIGSPAVPRKSCEPVRGTTSVDDMILFDVIAGPEFVIEQGGAPVVSTWRQPVPVEVKVFPERFPHAVQGKTSVDDVIGFVLITGPEVSMEECDLSLGGSWRKQGGQWK